MDKEQRYMVKYTDTKGKEQEVFFVDRVFKSAYKCAVAYIKRNQNSTKIKNMKLYYKDTNPLYNPGWKEFDISMGQNSKSKSVPAEGTLFAHLINCVEDNNKNNDAQWRDWVGSGEIMDAYKSSWHGIITSEEEDLTFNLLEDLIKTNGASKEACVKKFNHEIYGVNFTKNK